MSVFLLGSALFFVASLFWFAAKRKSGWGICGSLLVFSGFVFFVVRYDVDLPFSRVPVQNSFSLRNCKDRA